jgi:predicted site-specific integrase-resolvase
MIRNKKMIGIGEAANSLGVAVDTLRQWDKDGKFSPTKTFGNHRRYFVTDIERLQGIIHEPPKPDVLVATYSRVSSQEQKTKGDLGRQNARLQSYCTAKNYTVVSAYEEVGSGMSDTRSKLQQLFKLVQNGQITKVVVEFKDRLTRFAFNYLSNFFASYGVEIELVEEILGKSYSEELVADMLTLMASFSAKLYGKRSADRRKSNRADPMRIQDRATPEQPADHAGEEARGCGESGMELGTRSEETSTSEQGASADRNRPTSGNKSAQKDGLSVGLRSEQMCVSGILAESGSGIQQLLEEPQRFAERETSRISPVQEQTKRTGNISANRHDQSVRGQHPITSDGSPATKGKRLSAAKCQDIECHNQRESRSVADLCPS